MVDKDREDAFFVELEAELQGVNKHFFEKADRTVARYQRRTRGVLAFVLKPVYALNAERSLNQLAKDAYWCRKYARANAVALRKILKKHDKTCKNRRGKVFLQECWALSSPDGIGLFLHSPLLDELKAVQEKLQMSLDRVGAGREGNVADPNADTNEVYPLHPEEAGAGGGKGIAAGTSLSGSSRHACLEEGKGEGEKEEGEGEGDEADVEDDDEREEIQAEGSALRRIYRMSVDQRSVSVSVSGSAVLDDHVPATASINGTEDRTVYTHSLDASRRDALLAIEQATTCLLDSSDVEWEEDTPLHSEEETDAPEWPVPTDDGTFVERSSMRSGGSRTRNGAGNTIGNPNGAIEKKEGDGDGDGDGDETRENKPTKNRSLGKETYKRGVDPDTLGFSPAKDRGAASHDALSNSNKESSMAGASATYDEGDFKCPICLELMYRPVGLSCGHKFCRQCALDAAGFGKVFGAVRVVEIR